MNRKHALVVSAMLAVAVLAGALAVTRTAGIGAATKPAAVAVSDTAVAARQANLDRYEASLEAALAKKPPKLPPLPKKSATPGVPAAAPQVVYVRAHAPPSHAGGGHEADSEGDGFDD